MSKDLADKRAVCEVAYIHRGARTGAEFDRTAQLVSQKGEHRGGDEQRKAEPVLLLDVDTFKAENPEAEAFLNSDLWKKLQEHIRVLPKGEPDDDMGAAPPPDAHRDGGG
eukprot:4764931-Pyramimonas_sp.AAC.1